MSGFRRWVAFLAAGTTVFGTGLVALADPAFATTHGLTTSGSPSLVGQPVTFTETITPAPPASTDVEFKDGSTVLGQGFTSGTTATFTTSSLTVGSHNINTIIFTGSSPFPTNSITQVVQATTATTLAVSNSSPTFGDTVTFVAFVSSPVPGAGTPTGNVQFKDGATTFCNAFLSGAFPDLATCTYSALTGGPHSITAHYVGNAVFAPSTSAAHTVTVGRAATRLVAGPLLNNPSYPGYTANARLTDNHGAPLAGQTIVFTTGSTPICSAPTDGNGVAHCQNPSVISQEIVNQGYTATYGGSVNYRPSSANGALIVYPTP